MFVLPLAVLVGVSLLAEPTAAEPSVLPACEKGTRHLELAEQHHGESLNVCIHSGLSTTLVFDAKLARMELSGRALFRVADLGTESVTLVPTGALKDGERVPLKIFFQDGVAPASVTFSLVVHPSEADRQVEVTRKPRTCASCEEGEQQARVEARQCREEKARLAAECSGRVGLLGLLAEGLLGKGGIVSKDIYKSVTSRSGNMLQSINARSYRSDTARMEGGRKVVRLAVEQELQNNGNTPWTPAGALLVGPNRVEWKALGVWTRKPIAPGEKRRVGVEVEATEEAARGTFTLKLWNQEEGISEFFDGVMFP